MSITSELRHPGSAPGLVGSLQHRLVRQFELQAADWLETCRELPDWEDHHLVESSSPERLAEHKAMIDELESVGRWLESAAVQFGPKGASTAEQIRFTLQDLHDTRAMWHGDVTPARKQEILRDCFNEP